MREAGSGKREADSPPMYSEEQASSHPASRFPLPASRPTPAEQAMLITGSMLARERVDFERGMRYGPPLTLALIVTLVVIYVWQIGSSVGGVGPVLDYALYRDRVLAGDWYRMLSSAFLHGSPDHLIGNCISLYILGMACEHALGARGMALVYFASALGGAAVSMALSVGPSVGASGAIFGLMGAVVLTLHRHGDRLFMRDKRIGVVIGVWAGYTLFLGAFTPYIDNGAHLGGLIAGALVAAAVPLRLKLPA